MPLENLQLIWQQTAGDLEKKTTPGSLWHGRKVKVVDGSGLSMPDTEENQRIYPQSTRQKPGCGFPAMRIVAAFSLATGAVIGLAQGTLHCSERILFKSLWYLFEAGDVILADSGFCSYADFYILMERGIDSVMRIHHRRSVGVEVVKSLGRGDRLVYWTKMKPSPTWLEKEQWETFPSKLLVREVSVTVDIPGFRTENFVVATTLLDNKTYTASDLADLYRRRWKAELFLRDIKTTMGMDVLRCKSPEMIRKELIMYLIAYNLVRALMWRSVNEHDASPDQLSFKGALATINAWAPLMVGRRLNAGQWEELLSILSLVIALDLNLERPNRIEPRARKRRPKNYQLLNKPRRLFKEIQHRNRYTAPLS